ncbi:MAG: hypothetical protein IPK04_11270 [Bdellovibrionales bacterium]|nr:hypothetical protein [Bdellovibrionales bacterium]
MFDYLVKEIGYTPASAQRRIDAARMMQQVPELGNKIENGTLKLTQVSPGSAGPQTCQERKQNSAFAK